MHRKRTHSTEEFRSTKNHFFVNKKLFGLIVLLLFAVFFFIPGETPEPRIFGATPEPMYYEGPMEEWRSDLVYSKVQKSIDPDFTKRRLGFKLHRDIFNDIKVRIQPLPYASFGSHCAIDIRKRTRHIYPCSRGLIIISE